MFPILQLGPLAIQVPGLVLLAGFWVLINVIEKEAPRHKISPDTMSNMILIGLIAGIIGARLWYVARFISVYIANPLSLFSLNPATLATTAGIFIGLLAAVIYAQRKDLPLWPTLDALAPGFAVFSRTNKCNPSNAANMITNPTTWFRRRELRMMMLSPRKASRKI